MRWTHQTYGRINDTPHIIALKIKHYFCLAMIKFRKYISLISLFVFLIPFGVNAIHSIGHADEFHCTEKSDKHFHEKEHHCSVCDYIQVLADELAESFVYKTRQCTNTFLSVFYLQVKSLFLKYNFLLRGPPAGIQ